MKFNSQICTTREQSEKLLSLGLKRETADMVIFRRSKNADWEISPYSYNEWQTEIMFCTFYDKGDIIPAWSLYRLMCMIPNVIKADNCFKNSFSCLMNIMLSTIGIAYYYEDYDENRIYEFECFGNLMESSVSAIEWLIKEGYFNKEYLV